MVFPRKSGEGAGSEVCGLREETRLKGDLTPPRMSAGVNPQEGERLQEVISNGLRQRRLAQKLIHV